MFCFTCTRLMWLPIRVELEAKGVKVGPIKYPFYSPRGEFRIDDADGYTVFVSHAD